MTKIQWALLLLLGTGILQAHAAAAVPRNVDTILAHIEKHYAQKSFSAHFFQRSVLKAMDITDTAAGIIRVKYPGKMRWDYDQPERQTLITDGQRLWIYRPEENQVMTGKAPEIIGNGKGASFLSDLSILRQKFRISLAVPADAQFATLLLHPKNKTPGLKSATLKIDRNLWNIVAITTVNTYGDITKIVFRDIRFVPPLDDALFAFTIPPGADVVQMDGPQ